MGLWGKILANGAGSMERIVCKTCGDTYTCNIDKRFPYAVCGKCLDKREYEAKRDGDDEMYSMIHWEFKRRANL